MSMGTENLVCTDHQQHQSSAAPGRMHRAQHKAPAAPDSINPKPQLHLLTPGPSFTRPQLHQIPAAPLSGQPLVAKMAEQVLYFGYASNLLKERMLLSVPSAEFKSLGTLKGYKLAFECWDDVWQGAKANLIQSADDIVWGVVYLVNKSYTDGLANADSAYSIIDIPIVTPGGERVTCWTLCYTGTCTEDRRPSPQYLDVIIRGAIDNALPTEYIDHLRRVQHNGFSGSLAIVEEMARKV